MTREMHSTVSATPTPKSLKAKGWHRLQLLRESSTEAQLQGIATKHQMHNTLETDKGVMVLEIESSRCVLAQTASLDNSMLHLFPMD